MGMRRQRFSPAKHEPEQVSSRLGSLADKSFKLGVLFGLCLAASLMCLGLLLARWL
jgi:hypothetical protein